MHLWRMKQPPLMNLWRMKQPPLMHLWLHLWRMKQPLNPSPDPFSGLPAGYTLVLECTSDIGAPCPSSSARVVVISDKVA